MYYSVLFGWLMVETDVSMNDLLDSYDYHWVHGFGY